MFFSGARRAYDCLADPRVLRACQPGVAAGFNADRIIAEGAAQFIVGTSGVQTSMAPIITALIETIVNCGQGATRAFGQAPAHAAARALSRRVRQHRAIAPQLVTDGAGHGITTMIVLQSLGQARALGGGRGALCPRGGTWVGTSRGSSWL
jgi:hypothetical protein